MHRFFISGEEFGKDVFNITGTDVRHIAKVLRLGKGDAIEVLDGSGNAALACIEAVGRDVVQCCKLKEFTPAGEPFLKVNLLQGLPKGEKMELIIQKATELGVSRIIPVSCKRSVVQLTGGKAGQKQQRWQRVALEAARQCRRPVVPEVWEPCSLSTALAGVDSDIPVIMPWEDESGKSLREALAGGSPGEVYIIIGPEGGFDPEEVNMARSRGAVPVSLGPRILRTETAGLACLAAVMFVWGDFG